MNSSVTNTSFTAASSAPSNIAIVKYWGKQAIQEPVNPSISFTLSQALTNTNIKYTAGTGALTIEFLFEGQSKSSFVPKLQTLVNRLHEYLPFLKTGHLRIESANTFPHSSGIASSASSMASIAKALYDIQMQIDANAIHQAKEELTSIMARLGSGSACRSTQAGWALWGETPLNKQASNQYGISIQADIHSTFKDLQDSILVIRKGAKSVSSTVGHQLMEKHPYREGRIQQANKNTELLLKALKTGDFDAFATICEEEALSLHGLMMSSSPAYTLMAPETLRAIKRIKKFREHHHIPLTFTLDAGPNIHLIYPSSQSKIIKPFIQEHLKVLCENGEVIYDHISKD
ncbi:diphosphomevalonate/mevalonate 3,5-bisphosphate decarboxylase family protein [Carboxylicivirga sp. M1479]|uniref:diphosphomevalonate/mevalonate 3,5-bisphosphate decarboxylase family protein n=1 Tax=Carboxylicivirga sp. M1479 TaxID=2594476 RepID=UPI0011779410|nr:diphosphomevalonate decarboxylase [Carboxylicivirga sp. M1479]TRX71297.1 diphosphomevalonate decarboxylase [Carboxylicivirga sp. M1479]